CARAGPVQFRLTSAEVQNFASSGPSSCAPWKFTLQQWSLKLLNEIWNFPNAKKCCPGYPSALMRRRHQRIRRAKLDGVVQGAVERATHRVHTMDPLHRFADLLHGPEPQSHMDAPDDQHSVFFFHVADDVGSEASIASIDFARFQRAAERAHHSTRRRGDDIVDRGCMGFPESRGIDLVVLGNGAVNTECDRLRLAGQVRQTKGTPYTLNTHV